MQINIKEMQRAGYVVDVDKKLGVVIIYPENPIQLDTAELYGQLQSMDIHPRDAEDAVDSLCSTLHNLDIIRAIKAQD